jgi:hypothetical protein
MTLEQLLELPAADLERMTDKEIEDFFGPATLAITRPDKARAALAVRTNGNGGGPKLNGKVLDAKTTALLAGMGIDIEDL